MQQLYHLSVAKKQMLDVEIDHNKRRIEFIKHAFEMALIELLEECRDMVQKVKGFNLIAYIDVVLEALNKNIKDIQDVERRSELKGKGMDVGGAWNLSHEAHITFTPWG
ncbi:unnamed protein product [Rotaria magnacalcarata]|nr:unnamed protein product [Rotaria magnacalcarata]